MNNLDENPDKRLTETGHTEIVEQPIGPKISPGFLKNIRNVLLSAALPIIYSCGSQVEDSEKIDLGDRYVVFNCNAGENWIFQGNYPENFRLLVHVDGKEVFSQNVSVDHSIDPSTLTQFVVEGPIGNPKATSASVQTFDLNGNEIPIEANSQTKGMIGVPNCTIYP